MSDIKIPTPPAVLHTEDFLKYLSLIFSLLKKLQDNDTEKFTKLATQIEENKGKPGPKGEKGDKPVAGVDYSIPLNGKNGKDGRDGVNGKDGKDADESLIVSKASTLVQNALQPLIPTLEQIKQQIEENLPKLGQQIRDALELLPEEERLEIKSIKNLQKELDELKQHVEKGKIPTLGIGPSGGGRIVKSLDLSASLDGTTTVFPVQAMWRIIDVKLSSIATLRQTTDWVYDATAHTLTFTSQLNAATDLAAGQSCIVIYGE